MDLRGEMDEEGGAHLNDAPGTKLFLQFFSLTAINEGIPIWILQTLCRGGGMDIRELVEVLECLLDKGTPQVERKWKGSWFLKERDRHIYPMGLPR